MTHDTDRKDEGLRGAQNTDREIWRETPGDYYSPSIHVTKDGGISINVSGSVIVLPIRALHEAALRRVSSVGVEGKIDRDMRIGAVVFRKGISVSTVLDCAARAYQYNPTGGIQKAPFEGVEAFSVLKGSPTPPTSGEGELREVVSRANELQRQPSPPVPEMKAAIKGLLNLVEFLRSRPSVQPQANGGLVEANEYRFKKKPIEISAFDWSNEHGDAAGPDWWHEARSLGKITFHAPKHNDPHYLIIHTLEGKMRADVGDWIIRGVKGELYPCKPDIFAATYDPVDSSTPSVQEAEVAGEELRDDLIDKAHTLLVSPGDGRYHELRTLCAQMADFINACRLRSPRQTEVNAKLLAAAKNMLKCYGKPKPEEWLHPQAYEGALTAYNEFAQAIAAADTPSVQEKSNG